MPSARSKKKYRYPPTRVEDALTLKERIDAGQAAEAEISEHLRLMSIFRRKFREGALSPESARRLGIK
jgi:hypothetical protein